MSRDTNIGNVRSASTSTTYWEKIGKSVLISTMWVTAGTSSRLSPMVELLPLEESAPDLPIRFLTFPTAILRFYVLFSMYPDFATGSPFTGNYTLSMFSLRTKVLEMRLICPQIVFD